MKCEETAEFISALCDGETIPRAAAVHIGQCEVCRARLKEYAEIGAELRRVASLELMDETQIRNWEKTERTMPRWWSKGWEDMRIPRLVFASLLVAIVALSSSLVIVWARARTQGTVLMLTVTPPGGRALPCALSLRNLKSSVCAGMQKGSMYKFRVIATDGNRIELGVRVGTWTTPVTVHEAAGGVPPLDILQKGIPSLDNMVKDLPEKTYWFQPGEKLKIPFSGSESMTITGALTDHMPTLNFGGPGEQAEPGPNELRFVSPVLLRGSEVVFDFQGATAIVTEKNHGIELYAPGEGLFHISLSPLRGAVEGRITASRVSFQLDGQSYKFLLAAPVARGEHIWISRDGSFKPSGEAGQHGFIADRDESNLLANPQ